MNSIACSRRRLLARAPRLLLAPAILGAVGADLLRADDAEAVGLSGVSGVVSSSTGLNIRTGPYPDRRVLRWVPNGTNLSIIGTSSDWFKVTAAGVTGWVNSWYVLLTGTKSTAITRGNTTKKRVALTFDAGSDLGYTEKIITTLEQYGITATFGITGSWIKAYPDYAAWIVADGHQLLNHTLNHPSYTGVSVGGGAISPAKRLAQIQANENVLWSLAGAGSRPYWRPPYGDIDSGVLRDVGALGYTKTIMWTVDSMGWNGYTTDQIYQRVIANCSNGALVLMHVGSASQDANALDRIIRRLKSSEYSLDTVAKVLS